VVGGAFAREALFFALSLRAPDFGLPALFGVTALVGDVAEHLVVALCFQFADTSEVLEGFGVALPAKVYEPFVEAVVVFVEGFDEAGVEGPVVDEPVERLAAREARGAGAAQRLAPRRWTTARKISLRLPCLMCSRSSGDGTVRTMDCSSVMV